MKSPILFITGGILLTNISLVQASWFDDIGYTALQAQEGASTPDGSGIFVGVVEAEAGSNYTANFGSSQFTGKTLTDVTGTSGGTSTHANTVSSIFFGNLGSVASGITNANFYSANDYIGSGGLRTGETSTNIFTFGDPIQPNRFTERIINHSYVAQDGLGGPTGPALTSEALKRFDFSLVRDNTLGVVGLNNGTRTTIPQILAHNYNGISVGRTDGVHSLGTTTIEGAGRTKPDLVAPGNATSFATPMVSASAAILLSSQNSTANYEKITSQKAVLLAGATKEGEVFQSSWSRTDANPLDTRYGAGEVNILNSYNILAAGEKSQGATETTGWDYSSIMDAANNTYTFTIDPTEIVTEFSAALTWNREVDGITFASATLSDLNLELRDSSGNIVQSSISTVDNVEHLYINPEIVGSALLADTYSLIVNSASGDADYSLAWRSEVLSVPEPSTSALCLIAGSLLASRRRRQH